MNKTNKNYAKENYASPMAKVVELELGSAVLLPASDEGYNTTSGSARFRGDNTMGI